MMNFVFLDVHLTLRKTRAKTESVPTILSSVVLEHFVKKMCTKAIFWHFSSCTHSFLYIKCLTNTIRSHILVLKLFATKMQFS